MTTVDKDMADRMVGWNGQYPSDDGLPPDPLVVLIVRYHNNWDGVSYNLIYELSDYMPLLTHNPPYYKEPRIYWVHPSTLSKIPEGVLWVPEEERP